ncbi:MAG: hypothetical protein QOE04_5684 [Mycobacterium sp.]|nr:hypothetical protein [Mycobacterium sp.]
MALIAGGSPRRITALLHELTGLMRPRVKPVAAQSVAAEAEPPPAKLHYPPKRDRAIETAAMAREMYRL